MGSISAISYFCHFHGPLSPLCIYYKQDIVQNDQQGEVTLHPASTISHSSILKRNREREREREMEKEREKGRAGESSKT